MVKLFPVEEIKAIDQYTIEHEPISSLDLMERASQRAVDYILGNHLIEKTDRITIFCGQGNNGGDGLAIARILHKLNYTVEVYIIEISEQTSKEFSTNLQRLGINPQKLNEKYYDFSFEAEVIIDAIFGVGLSRPVSGFTAKLIEKINQNKAKRIAIDIPSGLFASKNTIHNSVSVFQADYTISFQFPKLAFLFPENKKFCGEWSIVDIGLSIEYINRTSCNEKLLEEKDIRGWLKKREPYAHKGTHGRALLMAGSIGKVGAAVMSAKACLRSGIGLLTTHIPSRAEQVLHTVCPETMLEIDRHPDFLTELKPINIYNCIGIGPGIGTQEETATLIHQLLENANCPLVLDADALNIVAKDMSMLQKTTQPLVLTPHPGEFERLVGPSKDDFDRFEKLKDFAKNYQLYVILKGRYTAIACPDGRVFFNPTGNPGMATGGSGDVLTGILTALIAQRYTVEKACLIACFIHGMAGDFEAKSIGEIGMLPSDLINQLPKVFKEFS